MEKRLLFLPQKFLFLSLTALINVPSGGNKTGTCVTVARAEVERDYLWRLLSSLRRGRKDFHRKLEKEDCFMNSAGREEI